MAYDSRVYRILIGSPSDVEEERNIAVRVIQEWNDLYSYSRKVVLLPLRWETHTAPEYGTRPQEVINRTIVDQCDLLVGIFWTRIGSPTGVAQSGTIEEIERVGSAGKPIMLYFSKIPIDPDSIDPVQNDKLKTFKAKTYPDGLVESYRSIIEFRDKFARQLEIKIRDLQKSDTSGQLPLSLNFLAIDDANPIGNSTNYIVNYLAISSLDKVPNEKRDIIKRAVAKKIDELSFCPFPLAIKNISSSGVRNVYFELEVVSDVESLVVTVSPISSEALFYLNIVSDYSKSDIAPRADPRLAKLDVEGLRYVDGYWKLSVEWEAIQPQRTRLIKPILYVNAQRSMNLTISAKVFADSFPEPLKLTASASFEVKEKTVDLEDVLPRWDKLLAEEEALTGSVKKLYTTLTQRK